MKLLAFLAALTLATASADAAVVNWTASLAPENEVPPLIVPAPDASGSAMGTLDTDANLLSWELTWSGLTGIAVGAHFHGPALPGQAAGIVVNIGSISGLMSPSIGSTNITDEVEALLLDGLLYINVHTGANPSGEIRGQVEVVPLPATFTLFLAALGILWIARRRAPPEADPAKVSAVL
jgi:CHRD domain